MRVRSVVRRAQAVVRPPRPPACPPGSHTGAPDFVGIGAQRAGTTWWYHLVGTHPDVQPAVEKELRWFDPYWRRAWSDTAAAEYARWFPRADGRITGEWSPGYMSHFWIPPLLRRAAPDARLLVLLRDPIERYRSGIALQTETRRATQATASAAFRLGCYATHLEAVFAAFPREQVLVLQHEHAVVSAGEELARTYRFLGLHDDHVPEELTTPRNTSNTAKATLSDELRTALVAAYRPEVTRLAELLPELDLGAWPNFRDLA